MIFKERGHFCSLLFLFKTILKRVILCLTLLLLSARRRVRAVSRLFVFPVILRLLYAIKFLKASIIKTCQYERLYRIFRKIVSDGEEIDEAVALVFREPLSYTGENVVELSCHGGIYITKLVLRAVLDAGAVPAQAGEFTKRAFLNGKSTFPRRRL